MTDNNENFNEKIVREISNSGFPLEIFASIVLNRNGWTVRPSLDYYDKKSDDYRETDILAYRKSNIPEIFNILVIECKKSDHNPWVFIQQKRIGNLSENLNIVGYSQDSIYYDTLEKTMNSHHYSKKPICTYYIVPFTNGDLNSKLSKAIFHAKNQVISAITHLIEKRIDMYQSGPITTSKTFFYPIIVFDGRLYSAIINEKNIELKEENHLLLSVERELLKKRRIYLSEKTSTDREYKPYLIDIVKKEHFEEYLRNFQKYYDERSEDIRKSFKTEGI
jgi:hypothetical protein